LQLKSDSIQLTVRFAMGILLTHLFIFFEQAVLKQGGRGGEEDESALKSSGMGKNTTDVLLSSQT